MSKIRTLLLLGLAGIALSASGCGGDGGGQSSFVVDWSMEVVGTHEPLECEDAGVTTVDLDIQDLQTKQMNHTSYPCSAHKARSPVFTPGEFNVTISLKTASGQVVSANGGQATLVRRGTDLGTLVFEIQRFELSWSIQKANMPSGCNQV